MKAKTETNNMNSTLNQPATQLARLVALGLMLLGCQIASAQIYTLWVDAARGKDANPGTQARPLQTLDRAISVANAISGGSVVISLRPGTYPLVPNATITRSHVTIQGLSNPILNADGFLDRF